MADPATPVLSEQETRTSLTYTGADCILDLPEIGCTLGLSELCEDVPSAPGANSAPS